MMKVSESKEEVNQKQFRKQTIMHGYPFNSQQEMECSRQTPEIEVDSTFN